MKTSASWADESGVAAIEYALIGALITVMIVSTVSLVGVELGGLYQSVCSAVAAATGSGAC